MLFLRINLAQFPIHLYRARLVGISITQQITYHQATNIAVEIYVWWFAG